MTRAPSDSHSATRIVAGLLLAAVAGLYASGYAFLVWIKQPPYTATPLTTMQYWHWYGDRPDVRSKLLGSLGGGLALAFGGVGLALIPRKRALHGDARFATRREIQKAGLLGSDGIILGRYGGKYLMLHGQQGVWLEAPPRSGKGVGFVIPNILNWPGSLLVNDIKGENYKFTAGYRAAHGHAVFVFDPLAEGGRTHRWNPLTYVSDIPYRRLDDLQRIAWLRYPDPKTGDPFWVSSARSLFLGVALYVFESEGMPRTMGEILRQGMASSGEDFKKHWARLIDEAATAGFPLDPTTERLLRETSSLAAITVGGIRKQFTAGLELWLNPMVDAATSANDFDLRELRSRRMSIYICTSPDNLERLEPLRNLFFQQVLGLHTRVLPEDDPSLKHQLMLMLDELTSLGRVPALINQAAFLPGYNIRICAVAQAYSQLIDVYGINGAATLRKMLAARIVFPPNSFDDAEAISKDLGTYTVRQKSRSQPTMLGGGKGGSVNVSEQPRRLLLAQEVKELGNAKLLLFYEGLRPVIGQRIRWFEDHTFMRRQAPAPAVPLIDIVPAAPIVRAPEPVEHRPVTAADVPTLDKKTLGDFKGDFDAIEVPKGQTMTDAEVQDVADSFLATLGA